MFPAPCRSVNTSLTITANAASKTYGATASFASTAFTNSGLFNGDTVAAVPDLDRLGGHRKRRQLQHRPLGSHRQRAVQLHHHLCQRHLTVNPAALTITANAASKTYGATASFASTAFTNSGLFNSDTVTGTTRPRPARRPPQPSAATTSSPRGDRQRPGQLHHLLRQRQLDGQSGGVDHHRQRRQQDLWRHRQLRLDRLHQLGPVQRRHGRPR